ncbi:Fe-S protein, homolog of lactate dehydrogenase SO1521 [hydrothermal vent metagenome]|uniref:Fe-S protein, homolog of lactate dehydrogenase SO1521 n=1 Tax=hydrothermal vent metagenome TaxID=652676 RepID=A0A3B0XVK3_9ZZZZ
MNHCTQTTLSKPALKLLKELCGSDLMTDKAERYTYGYDSSRTHFLPDAVVMARSAEQLTALVLICGQHNIPLISRGRGTGTCGGSVPIHQGIVVSFEQMNKIIKIDPANRYLVAEPGVTNGEIQRAAKEHGFFWAPDPTSAEYCTLGGNLAYNSAGPRAVKYGTTRDNVLGLKAITGAGQQIQCGVYTTKGVVGYDLTRLLIGSEGTLALFTQATLLLTPLPEKKLTLQLFYDDIYHATLAISSIMASSTTPCALEFMDAAALDLVRQSTSQQSLFKIPDQARSLLMVEVDGLANSIADSATQIEKSATNPGLLLFQQAATEEQAAILWQARKALSPALRKIAPKKINEDVVVPVSHIPELIQTLEELAQQYNIAIVNFGHAGNGNIHVNFLIDPDDPVQKENAELCLSKLFDLVLKLDGTLSGEHGVGTEKRDFIDREIDPVTMTLMLQIKKVFDPHTILNPGKIFPEY